MWNCTDVQSSDGTHPSDTGTQKVANLLLNFFKNEPKYHVCLIGGVNWPWRKEKDTGRLAARRVSPCVVAHLVR